MTGIRFSGFVKVTGTESEISQARSRFRGEQHHRRLQDGMSVPTLQDYSAGGTGTRETWVFWVGQDAKDKDARNQRARDELGPQMLRMDAIPVSAFLAAFQVRTDMPHVETFMRELLTAEDFEARTEPPGQPDGNIGS